MQRLVALARIYGISNMQYPKLPSLVLVALFGLTACGGSSGGSEPETPTVTDSDGDGVQDSQDAFPNDASETQDSDGDGVGDNSDAFPEDANETLDSDADGVGDNADAFPMDATEQNDTDGDGVGDNADVFPNDQTETQDSDGDGVGDNADAFPNDATKSVSVCTPVGNEVNLDALLTENCDSLSSYNLFADAKNPTTNVNGTKSLKYELSMPLFTDYATKYRFVVMPEDSTATYSEKEVMEMPVGTVLIKTFSLPTDTAVRGFENETLLETRLLIHRENGWVALPYRWNDEGTEADFVSSGRKFDQTVTHKGEELTFKYVIPSTTDCKECHQILDTDENGNAIADSGAFAPIGPKARFLNYSISYSDEDKNQLSKWAELEMLSGVPADLSSVDLIPSFEDDDVDSLSNNDWSVEYIDELARGYLDINCSHCHRPVGSANNYGLFLEYDRALSTAVGICKTPLAPPGASEVEQINGTIRAIVPGDADNSFMYERVSTDGELKMPKIGRSLVHTEGAELLKVWINSLDQDPFNQSCP